VCINAEVSLASAIIVGAVGTAGLRYVQRPRELVLATLPLAFAVHQASEAVTWTLLEDAGTATCTGPSVRVWALFAWVLLPVWLAAGITLVEPEPDRRRAQARVTGLAVLAATGWSVQAAGSGVFAYDAGGHLAYPLPATWGALLIGTYLVVVTVPGLLSSWPVLRLVGVGAAASCAISFSIAQPGWPSLWCMAAAFLSLLVVAHLRAVASQDAAAAEDAGPVSPSDGRPAVPSAGPARSPRTAGGP
jgi:hypothetical protein